MKTLTAFYDLEYGPISFDFAHWIVRAMCELEDRCCELLHAVVVLKENGVGGFSRDWGGYDAADHRFRLWHLVAGIAPLAGATLTIAASRSQAQGMRTGECWWPEGKAHFIWPLVDRARAGKRIPRLKATDGATRHINAWLSEEKRPVITFTLRNHASDPKRCNTDTEAWAAFRGWLEGRGYRVIELHDTFNALAAGRGHAELDCDLRLALYERAALNCMGHNGPMSLLWFSTANWLAFDSTHGGDTADLWKLHQLKAGEQFPWSGKWQRMVNRPDTIEALKEEFDRWAGATS